MYEAGNHLLLYTKDADPQLHRHHAAHIIISLEDVIEVVTDKETVRCNGILIPSGVSHTANTYGKPVLVFLFDSTTTVSKQIDSVKNMSDKVVYEIRKAFRNFEANKNLMCYKKFFQRVLECNGIDAVETTVADERIRQSLPYIQSRLHEKITCTDAANQVFLSEGRFSHLFKEQVGMSFAAYLIYQRLIKTYTDIINGCAITDASINAGFSSSAHFAEVSKRVFGLSATGVKKDLKFIKIAEI